MPTRPKDVLKTLLDYEDTAGSNFRKWFLKQFKATNDATCSLDEFAAYYINSLRQYADRHVKASCGTVTPKCQTPVRTFKANSTRENSTATPRRLMLDMQQQNTSTPNRSLHNDMSQKSVGADWGSQSVRRLSTSADRSEFSQRHDSSTPIKRNVSSNSKRLSTTPNSSLCLGDFMVKNTSNNRSHKKKNTSATSINQQQNDKPKKRVQPISVSRKTQTLNNSSSIFMGESSFSNENNILKISHSEVEDREQCAILAARKTLKSNAIEITKELVVSPMKTTAAAGDHQAQMITSTPSKQDSVSESYAQEAPLNLQSLENKTLQRLADIYVILIELNLTTNFLNELSFLLNLLNASNDNKLADAFTQLEIQDDDDEESSRIMSSLQDFNMSVCFALLCLNQQKYLLASLDSRTIKVVISSERFSYLKEDVRAFIHDIYQKKQQLMADSPGHDSSFCFTDTKPSTNVHFQQDRDSRQNFSSLQEFANFRPQRDLFYKCLKTWETNHLNPNWKFSVEIAPIIQQIFQQSEHFVNMAHFAKLFVSQLLLSASNASSPEEMGLDVDMQKFSRLTQRLIAPSQFSVDYQFPRAQAFFRDFILIARSLAFAEQLKMVLYSELMSLNDSSYDHISVTKTEDVHENPDKSLIAYCNNDQMAVRPEILNSTLILAKFFGFTISLPYTFNTNANNVITTTVEQKQLRLRNLIQPNIDLHLVVKTSIAEGKLLITIPWVVQYISMLDNITLQLEVHTKVLNLLFALHWHLARYGARALHITSKFIITACLSWLFDSKQFITEQYYNFRSEIVTNSNSISHDMELIKSNLEKPTVEGKTSSNEFELNPILESLLPVACPFLGEFRVSIMPAKYAQTKYASRTGRYRHITTMIADVSSLTDKNNSSAVYSKPNQPKDIQQNIMQAFYQAQNSSTRNLISFCSERCYKSVVKDGQLKILLPAKSKADAKVNKIDSGDFRIVFKEVSVIYRDAHQEAFTKWQDNVPKMLDKRIKTSLDSLLPEETSQILKKTYFMIIKKDAKKKISNWFYANIIKDNYFCVELRSLANKICAANVSPKQSAELKIINDSPRVSELLACLQYWLHCTSVRNDLFEDSKPIVNLLQSLNDAFKNVLPSILYRLVATYTVQLMQQIITSNCGHLTSELLEAACQVWLHPNMQHALNLPNSQKVTSSNEFKVSIYQSLVTVAFLHTIGNKTECYDKYGQLIISMITKGVISLKFANELFVPIFKYDWHPSQLNEISNMLRNIAQATTKSVSVYCALNDDEEEEDDEKSNLFMDMLADLSRDIELF